MLKMYGEVAKMLRFRRTFLLNYYRIPSGGASPAPTEGTEVLCYTHISVMEGLRAVEDARPYGAGEAFSRPLLFRSAQSTRSLPQKKRATVPGPVCEPMSPPMLLMSTLSLSFGKRSSTSFATASASSRQADMEMKHLPS